MSERTITLPERDEMLKRLRTVDDDPYLEEAFYRKHLLHKAGQRINARGLVAIFTLAIQDFIEAGQPPAVWNSLNLRVPMWIDALVEDEEIAKKAKALHRGNA